MDGIDALKLVGQVLVYGTTGVLGALLFFQALGGERSPRLILALLRLAQAQGRGNRKSNPTS